MGTKSGIEKWNELDGDNTLALDWPLNEDSHVWEIGGFEGRWTQQMWDKFHCNITIFEPQYWAVGKLTLRFQGNKKVDIRPYGLWTEDCEKQLGAYETDGASVFSEKEPLKTVQFKNYFREIYSFVNNIDVVLMNIEGAEFTLIPELINTGLIRRFKYFWCQFHPGLVEDGIGKTIKIFEGMEKTHEILWNCYPTAVAWKRR